MSAYRRRIGNEKARKKYQRDSDFCEKKKQAFKKSYDKLRQKKILLKEQEKEEYNRKFAKFSINYNTKDCQERNLMGKRRFNWVEKCFNHFFETFDGLPDHIKNAIISLVRSIDETYQKYEEKIMNREECAKSGCKDCHSKLKDEKLDMP